MFSRHALRVELFGIPGISSRDRLPAFDRKACHGHPVAASPAWQSSSLTACPLTGFSPASAQFHGRPNPGWKQWIEAGNFTPPPPSPPDEHVSVHPARTALATYLAGKTRYWHQDTARLRMVASHTWSRPKPLIPVFDRTFKIRYRGTLAHQKGGDAANFAPETLQNRF